MNYNLKGTDVSITPENRAYLEKRLSSLDKFVHDLGSARVDVELKYMALWDGGRYVTEFLFYEPAIPSPLRAEARGNALHESIDLAIAELQREITQGKRKQRDVLRRSALKVKEYLRGWRDRF